MSPVLKMLLALILFYAWHKLLGTNESQIWSVEYYHPLWQACIDSFHSIPLILVLIFILAPRILVTVSLGSQ